ncbi:MAG: hypothetical protein Q7T45_26890 [Bradyrhizobium sp.]|uniref:hypothetical protein n=1 Tax=Bradyrhizobium sp. TaxID=376 RepID=UPI0027171715|nr:hypothetical protein [Bradyrhizobium sp.]MDO8401439.1 hypothetical protein [Bradyrhizobium sp.]
MSHYVGWPEPERRQPLQPLQPPRLVNALPWLQGITAGFVSLGVRPDHVRSPSAGT